MRTVSTVRFSVGALLGALGLAGCSAADAPEAPTARGTTEVPVLTLVGPEWEIGDFEGGTDQTLDFVADVDRLPDGRVAVVDQGAAQVLVFDDGALDRIIGGEGDGPGEFRRPASAVVDGNSLWVLDGRNMRASVFGPDGTYTRDAPASEFSGDESFPWDLSFHGRFWVEGALDASERETLRQALANRPYPPEMAGYRLVRAGTDGRLWVRENLQTSGAATWFVLTATGEPTAAVVTPAGFEPMHFGADELLGRWRGEMDVNYVRAYRLESSNAAMALPSWLASPVPGTPTSPLPDSIRSSVTKLTKVMASLQEMNYANTFSYSLNVDSLLAEGDVEVPPGLELDVLHATSRGWGMVATMRGFSGMCALAYGAGAPAGLPGGRVVCGG